MGAMHAISQRMIEEVGYGQPHCRCNKTFCEVTHEHMENEYNECCEWRGGKNVS